MNPFLDSTVAKPLPAEQSQTQHPRRAQRTRANWSFPFAHQAGDRLARRASVAAMLAGVGVGLSAQTLDLNSASAEQLKDLRGVGPRTAHIIVQERNRAGPFESLEDLSDRVRGIGPKRLQTLQAAGLRVSAAKAVSGQLSVKDQSAASQAVRGRIAPPAGVATPTIETTTPH